MIVHYLFCAVINKSTRFEDNEALRGHAEGSEHDHSNGKDYDCKAFKNLMSQALGNSTNPYDYKWIVEAFKIARKWFPNAVLVYNDYNTFTWDQSNFENLVASLVNQGAPIDAYGHQSHDLDEYYSNNRDFWQLGCFRRGGCWCGDSCARNAEHGHHEHRKLDRR